MKTQGTWKFQDGTLTTTWSNGFRLTVDASRKGATIYARSFPPGTPRYDVLEFTRPEATKN